jgi:hypothetical protein
MDGPGTEDDTGRRIGLFCLGGTAVVVSLVVGWAAFASSVEDFYAGWWQGWAEARARLAGHPGSAAVVGLSAAFAGWGVGAMGCAVVGRRRRAEPGAAADRRRHNGLGG